MAGYPSDLHDKERSIVQPFLGESNKRRTDTRSVINAILYVVKTGCLWRFLPKEFPNYQTVFYYFNSWKRMGVLEKSNWAYRTGSGKKTARTKNQRRR